MIQTKLATFVLANFVLAAPFGSLAVAKDFQVTSDVYIGEMDEEEREPSSSNLTLFRDQLVYDFSLDSKNTIVFHTASGRLILLDSERKVKTEVSTSQLLAFARVVRMDSKKSDDPLLKFLAAPEFEQEENEGNYSFKSKPLTYRVVPLDAPEPEIAAQYREFCDWFARLNSLVYPNGLPPFGRMEVNAFLESKDAVPQQIDLNIAPHVRFGKREVHIRSEHKFRWGLTSSEVSKIEQADRQLATFKKVSLNAFRNTAVYPTAAKD